MERLSSIASKGTIMRKGKKNIVAPEITEHLLWERDKIRYLDV